MPQRGKRLVERIPITILLQRSKTICISLEVMPLQGMRSYSIFIFYQPFAPMGHGEDISMDDVIIAKKTSLISEVPYFFSINESPDPSCGETYQKKFFQWLAMDS